MPLLRCKNKRCSEYHKEIRVSKLQRKYVEKENKFITVGTEGFCSKCKKEMELWHESGPINTIRLFSPDKRYRRR